MEYSYRQDTRSQLDIPARISLPFKSQVETPERREEFDHVRGGNRRPESRARRKMRRLYKQARGIGFDRSAISGSLAGELSLNLRRDIEGNRHHAPSKNHATPPGVRRQGESGGTPNSVFSGPSNQAREADSAKTPTARVSTRDRKSGG